MKQITCLGPNHAPSSRIGLSDGSNSFNDFLDAIVCMYSPCHNAPKFPHGKLGKCLYVIRDKIQKSLN